MSIPKKLPHFFVAFKKAGLLPRFGGLERIAPQPITIIGLWPQKQYGEKCFLPISVAFSVNRRGLCTEAKANDEGDDNGEEAVGDNRYRRDGAGLRRIIKSLAGPDCVASRS